MLPSLLTGQIALLDPIFSGASEQQKAVLAFSDFISDNLAKCPDWWQQIQQQPPQPDEWQHYPQWLQTQLAAAQDENALMRELRLFRRHMLTRIAWMQTLATSSTEAEPAPAERAGGDADSRCPRLAVARLLPRFRHAGECRRGAAAAADPRYGQAGRWRA